MNAERVCGTCKFGAEAYDRNGNFDPQYVICQIKEAENRQRKPDRFQTISAVSRMHYYREACLHWKSSQGEVNLPMQEVPPVISNEPMDLYDMLYNQNSGAALGSAEPDQWQAPVYQQNTPPQPHHESARTAHRHVDVHVATAENEAEIKRLKNLLMQQEQMVLSLQNQNLYLSEENTRLKEERDEVSKKLEKLKLFDVALFAEVNYFALLGVKETSTSDQIKEAYRARMKVLHPDRFINISQRLNMAYETLMDPDKRKKYLQQIKGRPNA